LKRKTHEKISGSIDEKIIYLVLTYCQ